MNPVTVYQLEDEIRQHLPSLSQAQARGLLLMCLGIILQEGCHLSRLAENLPDWGAVNTVKQRLKRWISNDQINLTRVCEEWVVWVWSSCRMARPVLLIDETKLGDRLAIMMVSLAYCGRAIPLLWRCYPANSSEGYPRQGQVLLIYGLLAHVLMALPPSVRPLVQMDRGLAHSAAMLRALQALPVDYLVRVKRTARFTSRRGNSQLLRDLVSYGESLSMDGTLFDRDHAVRGRVCLIWEWGQDEPWCLFTNRRELRGGVYALRWWEEESFRDLKSYGWQWQRSRLRCPERMARLLLALALAYAWMLSLGGQLADQPAPVQAAVATRDEFAGLSLFRLGLRWLKRFIHTHTPPPVAVALQFAPPLFCPARP